MLYIFKYHKNWILFFCTSVCFWLNTQGLARAQKSPVGAWYMYNGTHKIANSAWDWYGEAQWHSYDYGTDEQELVVRTGIGYNLSPSNNNVLLGYTFYNAASYPTTHHSDNKADKTFEDRHVILQQFITKRQFSRVSLKHRYRIEERFFSTGKFDMRLRFGAKIPFNAKQVKKIAFIYPYLTKCCYRLK